MRENSVFQKHRRWVESAPYWFLPFLLFLFIASSSFAAKLKSEIVPKVVELATPFQGSLLFVPHDGKPHPGVVLLHGSEGGSVPLYRLEAQMLAMHGYAVLAFCWFNCAQNPLSGPMQNLENVDLNKTLEAMHWLKTSRHVQGQKMALYGFSRGAEQALILGWKTSVDGKEGPDAIAVHAASDTIVGGMNMSVMDSRCWVCEKFDLACFNDSKNPEKWNVDEVRWNPSCGPLPEDPLTTKKQAWIYDGGSLKTGDRIEIEKFNGPIFITHGTKDELWEVDRTLRLKENLENAKRNPEVHIFEGEKHAFTSKGQNKRRAMALRYFKKVLGSDERIAIVDSKVHVVNLRK